MAPRLLRPSPLRTTLLMLLACMLQAAAPRSPWITIWPTVFIVVIAYFLLIRPVQKQGAAQRAMRESLKPGDEILTSGGLYGTVTKIADHRVNLRVASGVQVDVARSAIVEILPKEKD